ncbi:hypothetical protein KIW84_022289 [Lathyrus oleraceus]|uniref:Uncharacterized protein n=1 Tax=Pisum sativum TaxID=3888 RepID=A0A9D4YA24_PEA|nr:hypothetical protein KIW84_022289 [Pisum sativum]
MHDVPTCYNPKEVSEDVCKYATKDVSTVINDNVNKDDNMDISQDVDGTVNEEMSKDVNGNVVRKSKRMDKLPRKIPSVPFDNVSFHSQETIANWKFVYNRRLKHERELSAYAWKCREITKLLNDSRMLKTLLHVWPYCPKQMNEFIVNLPRGFNNVENKEYKKIHV